MVEQLPAFYYALPVYPSTVPESVFNLIEKVSGNSADGHQHWFVEDGTQYVGEVSPVWNEAVAWCRDQFGDSDSRWTHRLSSMAHCYFTFAAADDAFAFRVRWC